MVFFNCLATADTISHKTHEAAALYAAINDIFSSPKLTTASNAHFVSHSLFLTSLTLTFLQESAAHTINERKHAAGQSTFLDFMVWSMYHVFLFPGLGKSITKSQNSPICELVLQP